MFKILASGCCDLLILWPPKTSLISKSPCLLNLLSTNLEWAVYFFGPSLLSEHEGQFTNQQQGKDRVFKQFGTTVNLVHLIIDFFFFVTWKEHMKTQTPLFPLLKGGGLDDELTCFYKPKFSMISTKMWLQIKQLMLKHIKRRGIRLWWNNSNGHHTIHSIFQTLYRTSHVRKNQKNVINHSDSSNIFGCSLSYRQIIQTPN